MILNRRSFIKGLIRCVPAVVVPSLVFDCKPKSELRWLKFYGFDAAGDPVKETVVVSYMGNVKSMYELCKSEAYTKKQLEMYAKIEALIQQYPPYTHEELSSYIIV